MLSAGLWHRGKQVILQCDTPAAGVNWGLQLPNTPDSVFWRIRSIAFTLVADANVANRIQRVTYRIGGVDGPVYAISGNPTAIVATNVVSCTYAEGYTATVGAPGTVSAAPLPIGLLAKGGDALVSGIANIQVGDQLSGVRVVAEEWVYDSPGQFVPDAGDGSARSDWVKLNGTLEKLNKVLEALQGATATP